MTQPKIKTKIEERIKNTGDTMTGALYIDAELGLITGSETQTSYSGMQATRLCTADDNNVNTAGFIINSTGESKFLHRRGPRSASEDAYFQFDGEGFSFYANGTKGSTPVNSTPVFQVLQNASRPKFKGQDLALYNDASISSRAYILGNDTEDSETWFKLASVTLDGSYRHYRLFFTASESDGNNTPTELCIYVNTGNMDTTIGKSVTIMSAKYDDVILNNLYILLSADTYTGVPIIAEIWFYKSSRYSSYTINNIYEMRRNNPSPSHWIFNEGATNTPLAEPTSGYIQYKAINILNGWTIGNINTPVYIEKNIPKTCNQFLPLTGGTLTGNVLISRPNAAANLYVHSGAENKNATIGVERTDVGVRLSMMIGSGGINKGLWDQNLNNNEGGWFCYTNGTDCYFATNSKYNNVYLGSENVYVNTSGVLYGAAWNDYAEYRNQKEEIPYGYCAVSHDDGCLTKVTEHLQICDGIVSDTFGFAIGETEECKTPLAVAGRVLAYCEGNRHDYHAGDVVGASKNGKVIKMTREEIKEYPDRIIGHVSEIPDYEYWGNSNVPVNGRIWIKVK